MKKFATILCSVFLSSMAFAQEHTDHEEIVYNKNITPYNDALETQQGFTGIQFIESAAWKSVSAQYPTWGARFNAYTGMPQRAFGSPIAIATGATLEQKAIQFMQQKLAAYNIPVNELVARTIEDKKYTNVNFKQIHNQQEVLFSNATFRFNKEGKIAMFGCNVHNNIPNLSATLTATAAIDAAKAAISTPITGASISPDLKILPVPNGKQYAYHLVYMVTVNTQDSKEMPGEYYTLVDANTGAILYRENKVHTVSHKVKGNVFPITWASPVQQVPLANLNVVQNGINYVTDANGNVTLPSATDPTTIGLTGKWCKVVDNQTTNNITYNAGVLADNDSTVFDLAAAGTQETKVNAYYHVDKFHEFMKSKLPSTFTDLDIQLLTRVDRTDGNCNAFYNGNSINFYYQGTGCASTAYLADVLYHEYGHGVTNDFWAANGQNFNNGAVGEGYSDMWAMSITDWPVIGPGFYLSSSTVGIRRYDAAPKVYPQDIIGEVHADGEIIAGAWWDTRLNIGSLDTTSSLFADSHSGLANGPNGAEGQVYFDILIDALTYDDNDGNISNGTPHFDAIVKAFARHGIYLLSNTVVNHTPAITASALVGNPITATLVTDFPGMIGDVQVFFRKKEFGITNPTDSLLCTSSAVNVYNAVLPPAPAGTIYEYYYRIKDTNSLVTTYSPLNARFGISSSQRNLPHLLPIGFDALVKEDFENGNPAQWNITTPTDNATGGKWIVATPVPSFINGINVQTANDHTTGSGKCAVTGNAAGPGSTVGTADVDAGRTTIITQAYNMQEMQNPVISYWRWYANSSGTNPRKDFWRVLMSLDGGNVWLNVERCFEPDVKWRRNIIRVKDYAAALATTNLSNVKMAFIATDSVATGGTGSLVEAAIDDFEIMDLSYPTSISTNESVLNASVYPNPAQNEVSIRLPKAANTEYKLVDATGKLIIGNTVNQASIFSINTSNISQGIYFLHLKVGEASQIVKLQIIK
jgi:Zn-dependent metalloprotease